MQKSVTKFHAKMFPSKVDGKSFAATLQIADIPANATVLVDMVDSYRGIMSSDGAHNWSYCITDMVIAVKAGQMAKRVAYRSGSAAGAFDGTLVGETSGPTVTVSGGVISIQPPSSDSIAYNISSACEYIITVYNDLILPIGGV